MRILHVQVRSDYFRWLEGQDQMTEILRLWWEKNARDFLGWYQHPIDVEYGATITEDKLRLIGPVAGKRVLEIGCGGGRCGGSGGK